MVLERGVINDSVRLLPESEPVRIYLPEGFNPRQSGPMLVYFDYDPYARQNLLSWKEVLDRHGVLLVQIQASTDSTDLMRIAKHTGEKLQRLVEDMSFSPDFVYTLGTERSSRLASLSVLLIKGVDGNMAFGGDVGLLSTTRELQGKTFIGAVGTGDYAYRRMGEDWYRLKSIRATDAYLNVTEGRLSGVSDSMLDRSLDMARFNAMKRGIRPPDTALYERLRQESEFRLERHLQERKYILARDEWVMQQDFLGLHPDKKWTTQAKEYGILREYRQQQRKAKNLYYQEEVQWERFWDYLLSDLEFLTLDNLGWWNYQITELKGKANSPDYLEASSAQRTLSYLDALIEDQLIFLVQREKSDGLEEIAPFQRYLYMIQTFLEPDNTEVYLKVVSLSALQEEFGAALYYLDLLFQKGFRDISRLDKLEHSALLRVSPGYNELVAKYLKESRY